ncbi:MAG TPA: methylenetetrahydrofolate--tRNA-(uracil(54)-C(5))-methyltransferase (FADH(2)-oxidizing) TrmFO [Pyrinomonadaceae bacterium]|nr:methylenetetrahydrofolate--tRNA-(uracil(54)-C(5))-methyltransferase (FADH(2)-oxidizing) TrmFO [Pyrinomonadaceae bacterium]
MKDVVVIGGGFAGVEAAWQAAREGARVRLYEMRPVRQTPAHRTDRLAEIVCSNSLKSDEPGTAPYLLKEELRRGASVVLDVAMRTKVPAGAALAVDRQQFAEEITKRIEAHPNIEVLREEATAVDETAVTVIAAGPLCSDALAGEIARLTAGTGLYFYDAISPIVAAESVDTSVAFRAARYGKGGDDYLNCPLNEEEYARFYEALTTAQSVPLQRFEETRWFEACLPIEELARRGVDTLRYGPMKPVGLRDPRTGREPYAAVQLRQENLMADAYNLVGFQNHLRYGEQARVLRLIPGLERAEFLQYGQIHRNTYINAPRVLAPTLQMRERPEVFFAGQISGVEGYVESVATGWLAGRNAARVAKGEEPLEAPPRAATGALARYVSGADAENYQPVNITFALLVPLGEEERRRFKKKRDRHVRQVELALEEWDRWLEQIRGGEKEPLAATL